MLHKRLIYAEDLGTAVREYCKELIDQGKREMCVVDFNAHIQKIIKQQPTASIFDQMLKGEVDEDSNEVQGEDAKKPYEKRVSGYKATFEEAVESFIDRYVGESTAKDFKALVDDINDLKKEVRSWRDADVHM